MEKLFIKIVLLLFFVQISVAQENLCIFKINGIASLNKKTEKLAKGILIYKKDVVKLSSKSKLIAIDNMGSLYELNNSGKYTFSAILKNKKKAETSGLTSKYFKYVWSQLTHEKELNKSIAGVFRGNVLMKYPPDNASISGQKISLKWSAECQDLNYVFIRNLKDDTLLKLQVIGSEVGLYTDSAIFSNGTDFEWFVTTTEFPNLKNIPYFRFKTITYIEYSEISKSYQSLIEELVLLGLTQQEINETLCESYGICQDKLQITR